MEEEIYVIEFENISKAEANRYADELSRELQDSNDDITVNTVKSERGTQDFGDTLILGMLSAPATLAAIKTIQAYLLRKQVSITISKKRSGEKTIRAQNVTGSEAVKIAEAFEKRA